MRIAVVSDIHGNLTALEAVLADLKQVSPDLIFHGGDLAHGGSGPAETIDRIRDLGWPGVMAIQTRCCRRPNRFSNSRVLCRNLNRCSLRSKKWPRRNAKCWERKGPRGSPSCLRFRHTINWRWFTRVQKVAGHCPRRIRPMRTYGKHTAHSANSLQSYGHIHRSFIRKMPSLTVVNTGSVSLTYDGDPRAAYLLLDDSLPTIRRVDYDLSKELRLLSDSGLPHADWIARTLKSAKYEPL